MKQKSVLAFFLALAAGAAFVRAQDPQSPTGPLPTFKAEVEYVEVDALVTDQSGRLVRDMRENEFQVFEDGKLQKITNFTLVDIPIERAERPLFSPTAIERDVVSNERPFDGRVYVMILDDLHVAALRSQRVRNAARQFIERNLGANDLMAVVFTGGRAQNAQEFTNNKRLLLRAVDTFLGQKLESATLSRNREYFRQLDGGIQDSRIADPDEMQRAANTRSLLRQMTQVADWFGGVRGRRKTMLVFSEGIDYDLTDVGRPFDAPSGYGASIMADIREAIYATARSNVSIYTVDPRGLTTQGDDTIEVQQFADAVDTNAGIGMSSLNNELRLSQNSLRQLAEETGGFATVNRNDFVSSFDRIVADNSSYYVLAYYPPSTRRDGRFHRIEVKTTRPGVTVRSRRGYMAARGRAPQQNTKTGGMPPELFAALNSPLPVSGLTMRAFAAPFKGAAPNASVLVGLELFGRDLPLDGAGKVDVSFIAIDANAKILGSRNDTLTLNLRPESRARVAQSGVRVLNRVDLPAGRYQLRIAAKDAAAPTAGSIIYDLDVPDFFKSDFGLSGIAITSLGSGAMMTAKPDESLREVLPAPPVGQRVFPQNDELALFAEIYDNSRNATHKVDISTSILTDEGRVLFKNEETRDASELQGAKGGFGYTARIPLSEIPPGLYVLQVEARSRLEKDAVSMRQVQIRIVPTIRQ